MAEKSITISELSKKIGLNESTLNTFLGRFEKYAIGFNNQWRYKYKYNYLFLTELKQFFCKKMYAHNGLYFTKYYRVVTNLNRLIEEL